MRTAKKAPARKAPTPVGPAIGKKVPDLALPATRDQTIRLKDLGQPVVLYF